MPQRRLLAAGGSMACALKAIADPARRTILRSLSAAERGLAVGAVAPPTLPTRHLRVLRRAGLLVERRHDGQPSYVLERARLQELAAFLRSVVAES